MENKEITRAIDEQRVFYAKVTRIIPGSKSKQQALAVPINVSLAGSVLKGVIYEEDLDADVKSGSFSYLINMMIPFVIKAVDENTGELICSRSIGQQLVKEQMMDGLQNGKFYDGTITGFSDFGAFVDVNGVMGILRNADYSTDYSRINERYKIGDRISVKCRSISAAGRIAWEAVNKFHRTEPVECDLEVGSLVLGRIVDIKDFQQGVGIFVQMNDQKELDILCGMPPELEVEKGVQVIVRIASITPGEGQFDKPRLRGYIVRLA